jgi:hypothetical protein
MVGCSALVMQLVVSIEDAAEVWWWWCVIFHCILSFEKGRIPHFWINTIYIFCTMNTTWLSCLSREQTVNITLKQTLVKVQNKCRFLFASFRNKTSVHFVAPGMSPHSRVKWIVCVNSDDNRCYFTPPKSYCLLQMMWVGWQGLLIKVALKYMKVIHRLYVQMLSVGNDWKNQFYISIKCTEKKTNTRKQHEYLQSKCEMIQHIQWMQRNLSKHYVTKMYRGCGTKYCSVQSRCYVMTEMGGYTRAVSRQRLGKHVLTAKDMNATML